MEIQSIDEIKFQDHKKMIRLKFNMNENDKWVIEQLYMTLENHPGGFLLKFDNDIFLGIKLHYIDKGLFNVFYKDIHYPFLKEIKIDSQKLITDTKGSVKVQWFGCFNEFASLKISPSFTLLDKFKYELLISKAYIEKVDEKTPFDGDYYAFFAKNSRVKYHKKVKLD